MTFLDFQSGKKRYYMRVWLPIFSWPPTVETAVVAPMMPDVLMIYFPPKWFVYSCIYIIMELKICIGNILTLARFSLYNPNSVIRLNALPNWQFERADDILSFFSFPLQPVACMIVTWLTIHESICVYSTLPSISSLLYIGICLFKTK